jgi:hypothetical protein
MITLKEYERQQKQRRKPPKDEATANIPSAIMSIVAVVLTVAALL